MTLINGPYNGREIEDLGTVLVKMSIYASGKAVIGESSGHATYEPSKDRARAFWLDNVWTGPILGIVE